MDLNLRFDDEEPYESRGSRTVVCPAKAGVFRGIKPSRVRVSNPLAWVAIVEEMKLLKPTDKVLFSRMSELSGCNANERIGGSESVSSRGRACNRRAKAAGTVEKRTETAVSLDGVVATA